MHLLKTKLSLDGFMLEMLQTPPDRLQLEQLQSWMADLDLKPDLFRHHIAFCDQTYRRRLICRTAQFDLLLLCWQPGQCSSVHDHANSLNVTRVYQGQLTARTFAVPDPQERCCLLPLLKPQQEEALTKDELATVDRHQIHQLANTSDENLVTLHVYARPLQTIQVYCPRSGRSEQVSIHYDMAE